MAAVFSFLIPVMGICLWALFYFVIYAALRASGRRSPQALNWLGSLSLGIWLLFFVIIARFVIWEESDSYATALILGMVVVHLLTLGCGGLIMRFVMQKQRDWWHGVLFCASYFVIGHSAAVGFILLNQNFFSNIDLAIIRSASSVGVAHNNAILFYSGILLLWFFPIGAPLFEMILRSFRRLRDGNKTGSFA